MQKHNVLIVDDEPIVRESIRDWLQDSGYDVDTARDGEEALQLVDKKDYSFLILDIRLPDINGIEILDIIRKEEQHRGIPLESGVSVIMLTAYDRPWMDPSLIKGSDDFILKTDDNEKILERIKEKLGD